MHYPLLLEHGAGDAGMSQGDQEAAEIAIKYSGFIDRQQKQMEMARTLHGRLRCAACASVLSRSRAVPGADCVLSPVASAPTPAQVVSKHSRPLPADMDYYSIQTLSMEGREKLSKFQPASIGQASRLGGVSPADITALLLHMELEVRQRKKEQQQEVGAAGGDAAGAEGGGRRRGSAAGRGGELTGAEAADGGAAAAAPSAGRR